MKGITDCLTSGAGIKQFPRAIKLSLWK